MSKNHACGRCTDCQELTILQKEKEALGRFHRIQAFFYGFREEMTSS